MINNIFGWISTLSLTLLFLSVLSTVVFVLWFSLRSKVQFLPLEPLPLEPLPLQYLLNALNNQTHICLYNDFMGTSTCAKSYRSRATKDRLEKIETARSELQSIINEVAAQANRVKDVPAKFLLSHPPQIKFRLLSIAQTLTCIHHQRKATPRYIVSRWYAYIQQVEYTRIFEPLVTLPSGTSDTDSSSDDNDDNDPTPQSPSESQIQKREPQENLGITSACPPPSVSGLVTC